MQYRDYVTIKRVIELPSGMHQVDVDFIDSRDAFFVSDRKSIQIAKAAEGQHGEIEWSLEGGEDDNIERITFFHQI